MVRQDSTIRLHDRDFNSATTKSHLYDQLTKAHNNIRLRNTQRQERVQIKEGNKIKLNLEVSKN